MEIYNGLPFVNENTYEEDMTGTVEPYLSSLGGDGFFDSFDGREIHYEKYICENAKASIVISHGFTESAEKFREMSFCFLNMGYNVFAIDHRGHGKSFRYVNDTNLVHINSFDEFTDDLHTFVHKIVKPASEGLPLFIYSHSMGGAVAIQYLQTHPGIFSKAVLSAPMVSPRTAGLPHAVTLLITKAYITAKKDKAMVIGYGNFNPDRTYENSHDTSKARFDYYQAKRIKDSSLQTSSPSNRWVNEAVKVKKLNLDPIRCGKIKCPVLLCQPETDSSVFSDAENKFVSLLPDGRLENFKFCRHEIYMSIDDTLKKYLDTIRAFLEE